MTPRIAVIGANGRSGRTLCRALLAQGYEVHGVLRRPESLPEDLRADLHSTVQGDLTQPHTLGLALKDVDIVANTAHARHLPAILQSCSVPIIALGSTRKFTRWPDAHGTGVIAGETALLTDGRPSLILHPTMIYGANGENNVQRLAALLKKIPVVPLPGGGMMKVQPIEQSDVTRCLIAGIKLLATHQITGPETLVIAGGTALPYRDFIRMICHHAHLKQRPLLTLPSGLLTHLAWHTRYIPFLPTIMPEEIRRLLEDKSFDTTQMNARLHVNPSSLEEGLTRLFNNESADFLSRSAPS